MRRQGDARAKRYEIRVYSLGHDGPVDLPERCHDSLDDARDAALGLAHVADGLFVMIYDTQFDKEACIIRPGSGGLIVEEFQEAKRGTKEKRPR